MKPGMLQGESHGKWSCDAHPGAAGDSPRSAWFAMKATAVTIFDRVDDTDIFDGWVCDVRSTAQAARGFVALSVSIRRDAPLDWAVAVTFDRSGDCLLQRVRRNGG